LSAGQPARGAAFSARVIAWQRRHGRHDLPWSGERDPYRVWLSEVMLQQTQVATVREYYRRFLQRFPDVRSLAAAPLDGVLAQWSGLGYYSRARNLHRCAQVVRDRHGARFPGSAAALAELPGVGRSTAAAIAAFCFGERAAILDGNVKRVLARALGFAGDLAEAAPQRALWQRAEALLPPRDIERYTQGLMDLGATVCLAKAPRCAACPLQPLCAAHRQGRPEAYPVKSRRSKRGQRESWLVWLRHRGRSWLVRRGETGVWAGLWCLPQFDQVDSLQALCDRWPGEPEPLPPIEHALTHFDWTLYPLVWYWPERASVRGLQPQAPGAWFTRAEALALGLPAPIRRLLQEHASPAD
jgi:A/G-specific adenine glycosylase